LRRGIRLRVTKGSPQFILLDATTFDSIRLLF
jgi:hypothetical protein